MKQLEYFQETIEDIADDAWFMTLKKYGQQGWKLCTIALADAYKKLNR